MRRAPQKMGKRAGVKYFRFECSPPRALGRLSRNDAVAEPRININERKFQRKADGIFRLGSRSLFGEFLSSVQ